MKLLDIAFAPLLSSQAVRTCGFHIRLLIPILDIITTFKLGPKK